MNNVFYAWHFALEGELDQESGFTFYRVAMQGCYEGFTEFVTEEFDHFYTDADSAMKCFCTLTGMMDNEGNAVTFQQIDNGKSLVWVPAA